MNLPNKLTVARLILVPFFVFFLLNFKPAHHYLYAGLLFGAAAITDHFDGKLARKNNQITNFGKFLDPIADKVMVIAALVCFVQLGLTDAWFLILIVAREFLVTSLRLIAVDEGVVLAANNWGKAKTVSQIVATVAILIFQYIQELISLQIIPAAFVAGLGFNTTAVFTAAGNVLMVIATLLTVISGFVYLKDNAKLIDPSK